MLLVIVVVLNPAYKLKWIKENWTADEARNARSWVLETV